MSRGWKAHADKWQLHVIGGVLARSSLLLPVLFIGGCANEPPVSATEVLALSSSKLPSRPDDAAWDDAPVHTAPLVLQDMVEPRLLTPSTGLLRIQAISDGQNVAFRLAWSDSTRDDAPATSQFVDACAVQLPQAANANVPAPQMGELGGTVEITYWSAAWQAEVNGRGDTIQALYPNATVDHYPFDAPVLEPGSEAQAEFARRYAPAKAALDQPRHPEGQPVQDLLAEGPGTLTPAPKTISTGSGEWVKETWAVVIVRPLSVPLREKLPTQVAFAIWNGDRDEVGARKMRSVWIPMSLQVQS